jgi:hypothetical protein
VTCTSVCLGYRLVASGLAHTSVQERDVPAPRQRPAAAIGSALMADSLALIATPPINAVTVTERDWHVCRILSRDAAI